MVPLLLAFATAIGITGCASPAPKGQGPSVARTRQPIYLRVGEASDSGKLVRVTSEKWWSSGERGGSIGQKMITEGKPYLFFLAAGFTSSDYALIPLEQEPRFAVTVPGGTERMLVENAALAFKAQEVWIAICPAEIAAPKRSDCLFTDEVKFEVQQRDGSIEALWSGQTREHAFRYLALKTAGAARALAIYAPNQVAANARFEALHASFQQAAEAKKAAEAQAAAARNQQARVEAEAEKAQAAKFLASAKRGTTVFCRSAFLVQADTLTSGVGFECDRTGANQIMRVRDFEENGWDLVREQRQPMQGMLGVGYSVNVSFKKL